MVSYKLLTIFTVFIVIRSSCGEKTECERSLEAYGIKYDCGYLNYNFVKRNASFMQDYDSKVFLRNSPSVHRETVQAYYDSVQNFHSIHHDIKVSYKELELFAFCQNRKLQPIRKELNDKMDDKLMATGRRINFEVDAKKLLDNINACTLEITEYKFEDNPYTNALISYELWNMEKNNLWMKPIPMKDDTLALYSEYKTNIEEYRNDDIKGIENAYTEFIPYTFCKSYSSKQYQNENENDKIIKS